MKKKNKFVEFLTKENKYEKQILLVLSIIAIIIGLLGITGIIQSNEGNKIFIILLIIGPLSLIINLLAINKEKQENKKPKAKIYEMLEKKEYEKVKSILLDHDYVVQSNDDEYFIYLERSFDFVAVKEEFQLMVTIYKDKITLDIDFNDEILETINEEYFDNLIESLTHQQLIENSNVIDVINMMDNMISVFGNQLLELYEKYKK